MYSVVLMTALTAGSGVPDFGPKVYLGPGGCDGAKPCSGYDPALQGWPGYGSYPLGGFSNCWGGCSGFFPIPGQPLVPTSAEPPRYSVPDQPGRSTQNSPDAAAPTLANDRARLIIDVPPGARLYLNDQPTRSTAAVRSFLTPPLAVGDTYYYVVRVEMVRDGKVVNESKRVLLHPGEEVRTRFAGPEVTLTSARTR
jgi:uncharacterized protein (TIGR03000 family)